MTFNQEPNMKVWINQKPDPQFGGLYRVVKSLYDYLPQFGVEIVEDIDQADVVHCHISTFGVKTDKPLVISSHGMLWDDVWGEYGNKKNSEFLNAYCRADVVTAPSDFVARSIARYTLADPIKVPHGVDYSYWQPSNTSKDYVLWNKARIDAANDPQEMNRLAALAPEIKFISTFGKPASNVTTTGKINPDEMLELVSGAVVYLDFPKESGGPCFGVLEAMACGVPVLAWDFGGNAESIKHLETGYLACPYDYEDLLNGLYYCINNRMTLGENARADVIANYSIENSVAGYIDAYETALDNYYEYDVSVIIPCHNLGRFLPVCLDSVLKQQTAQIKNKADSRVEQENITYEIIVVNDASSDNTESVMADYAEDITRITNPKNLHVSASRNIAVENAKGRYILPLDADDRLAPNALVKMVNYLDDHPETDIVTGHLLVFHESDLTQGVSSGWPNGTQVELQFEGHNRLPYCSMYRRKVYDRVGGYRTRIKNGTEDADFWCRALGYGYKAHLLEDVTLYYTHREKSLGKTNPEGVQAWLKWFNHVPTLTNQVHSFYPPKVSVVIPVGPGHEKYIQGCIDSLIAQTEDNWEAIVVNDTGKAWNGKPIKGAAFVKFIDTPKNSGVAFARNLGIKHALADRIVFLDVDDILQPKALEVLLASQDLAGGWIYGDWYLNINGEIKHSEAEDWNEKRIQQQSLSPITGIYEKKHVELVGGFSEDAPGWEDWDFHLKLLEQGICGTRVKYPLIMYNMNYGWRREDNFKNKDNLIKYIQNKHKGKAKMGCSKCGGGRTVVVTNTTNPALPDMVQLYYTGNESKQRINSPTHRGTVYQINKNKRYTWIFKEDLEWALLKNNPGGSPMFEVVEQPSVSSVEEDVILESQETVSEQPIELLGMDEAITTILKETFPTVADLRAASDGDILAVKGIGQKRLKEIKAYL